MNLTKLKRDREPAALMAIREQPDYIAALRGLLALEDRLAQAEKRRTRAVARGRSGIALRLSDSAKAAIVAGGTLASATPAAEIEAADTEIFALREAIGVATAKLDDVSGDLSVAACEALQEKFFADTCVVFKAVEDLWDALVAAGDTPRQLRALGYSYLSGILPTLIPHEAAAVGDPNAAYRSAAWYFRRALEERGLRR